MDLNNNAIFIADSHYNSSRKTLYNLLIYIDKEEDIKQLFLMGDIFDFLSYEIEYFKKVNKDIIELINLMSNSIDIIYFEGNHDFNLKKIFPNITVISRDLQPLYIKNNNTNIALAHGDIFTPLSYNIFTTILRDNYFLRFLNFIDINNFISKYFEKKLKLKVICHQQENYDKFIKNRIKNYGVDLVIEGHFHQGYLSERYINIPSLACDNRYMRYENKQFNFFKV